MLSDDELDEYVASLLTHRAQRQSAAYSTLGFRAFLKDAGKDGPVGKPNTRFLKNIVRDVDGYNAALARKEERESREKLKELRKSDGGKLRPDKEELSQREDDWRVRRERERSRSPSPRRRETDGDGRDRRRRSRRDCSSEDEKRERRHPESRRKRRSRHEGSEDEEDRSRKRGNTENVIVKTRIMKQTGNTVAETMTIVGTLRRNDILPVEIERIDGQMIPGKDIMKNRRQNLAIRPLSAMYLIVMNTIPVVAITNLPTYHPMKILNTNLRPTNVARLPPTLTPQWVLDLQSTAPNFASPKDVGE